MVSNAFNPSTGSWRKKQAETPVGARQVPELLMEALWATLYRTSSVFMQAGSQSCLKQMTTTRSSSERIACLVCLPAMVQTQEHVRHLKWACAGSQRLMRAHAALGCIFCSSHLSHCCNKIPNTNDLKLSFVSWLQRFLSILLAS